MASMTCHYYSSTLGNNIAINVIIPTPQGNEQIVDQDIQKQYQYETGLPVVYLLHGAYGDFSSWIRYSNIERYAQERCCAVVMASAGNYFYQDMYRGSAYRTFFTEELPMFITSVFPVSKKREDTYIAGFSMGGYGAWYLALSAPHLYAKAASMSGALDIAVLYRQASDGAIDNPFPWHDIFQDPEALSGSDRDLFTLYEQCRKNNTAPSLYQACGTGDFLYDINRSVKKRMEDMQADLVYEEGPGGHNWDFISSLYRLSLNIRWKYMACWASTGLRSRIAS